MVKTRADYEPDIGGLFDDFDSPILSAFFGENPREEYKAKASDSIGILIELDSGGEKPITQWYSIGGTDQWQILNNGAEVVRTKNPDKHAFHQKAKAYALVEKMITLVGDRDKVKGMDYFISKKDAYMTQNNFYTGLNFHWKQQDYSYTNPETKEVVKTTGLFPDKFLGEATVTAKAAATPVPTDELDTIVVELSEGKDTRGLKQAVIRDDRFKGKDAFVQSVVNGSKIDQLEKVGKITKGPDGKYV